MLRLLVKFTGLCAISLFETCFALSANYNPDQMRDQPSPYEGRDRFYRQSEERLAPSRDCNSFSLAITYALLQVGQQGLDSIAVITPPDPGESGDFIQIKTPYPFWRSAVDLSFVGKTEGGWNVGVNYFLLSNTGNKMKPVDGTPFYAFAWRWNNSFNLVEVSFSKTGCSLLSPYVSLLAGYETQQFTSITRLSILGSTDIQKNNQNWFALGPLLGADFSLPLGPLSFVFSSGFALVASHTYTTQNQIHVRVHGDVINKSSERITNSFTSISSLYYFLAGFRITGSCFSFQIDWRGDLWTDHLSFAPGPKTDLGMQGGAVTFGADF